MLRKIRLKLIDYFVKSKLRFTLNSNFKCGSSTIFKERPILRIYQGSKFYVGSNTRINSCKVSYHLNMFSACKIMIDGKGAQIIIGNNTRIHGTCIHARRSITIGDNCLIAANTQIMDCNGHDLSMENVENRIHTHGLVKPVIIEDSVWIGTGVVILPGVTLGRGSVISANSVVTKSIPPRSLAGGNPAIVIKRY